MSVPETLSTKVFFVQVGASLACGGLTPLWSRSIVIDNKAASSRRTPGRRPFQGKLFSLNRL